MKVASTLILRAAVFAAGFVIFGLCCGVTWLMIASGNIEPEYAALTKMLFFGVFASAIPFFLTLRETLKLLTYIDNGDAFSEKSVHALRNIMLYATAVFLVCAFGGLPFFYQWAQLDDAPGLVIIGMGIAAAAFIIAVFASVLKRLLQDAIEIKSENDLTV